MEEYLQGESLRKHCYATEAVIRAMAEKLGHDPELWGIVGLLHDLDYEETKDQPSQHGLRTAEILKEKGVTSEVIEGIKAHNAEALGIERKWIGLCPHVLGMYHRNGSCHHPGLSG